ncbi:MAG TPA: GNAT family N-acetyltransferase [Thermoleophilaceae bacterium]|nr:GNAT family N-acetyltransferase [Thermoleophilaceae bacterium]
MEIRDASENDGAACAAIYEPYVRDTAITFETVPPTAAEMSGRIARSLRDHAWVVAQEGSAVVGYAYGGLYKERAAYAWACEVSVYLQLDLRRTGLGRALYRELFARLAGRGYLTAVAGTTLPNPASEGLHRAMGFQPAGTYRRIGFKHGAWHDVMWTQRDLVDPRPDEPGPLR